MIKYDNQRYKNVFHKFTKQGWKIVDVCCCGFSMPSGFLSNRMSSQLLTTLHREDIKNFLKMDDFCVFPGAEKAVPMFEQLPIQVSALLANDSRAQSSEQFHFYFLICQKIISPQTSPLTLIRTHLFLKGTQAQNVQICYFSEVSLYFVDYSLFVSEYIQQCSEAMYLGCLLVALGRPCSAGQTWDLFQVIFLA